MKVDEVVFNLALKKVIGFSHPDDSSSVLHIYNNMRRTMVLLQLTESYLYEKCEENPAKMHAL